MSHAVVQLTIHLERHDHSKSLDNETALSLAEELDGEEWWDDDYKYEVSVIRAEVITDKAR